MGEQANKIGKKLEGFGENLFSRAGWIELCRDKEIQCHRSSHSKKTHGIDILCKFKNPYINSMQSIVIECKNRQMKSITQDCLETWVTELINNIECAQSAPELSDIEISDASLNTGLLLVHANDVFEKAKYEKYIKGINLPNRRHPINIYVATNEEINRWTALFDKIDLDYNGDLKFFYPSINGSNKEVEKHLTIQALFSKYIFAQRAYTTQKDYNGFPHAETHMQSIVFCFDTISKESFKYIWSMFKHYQLQGVDEYVFVFFPKTSNDVQFITENFITTLKSTLPPIDAVTAQKIKIDFMDNRLLSPVDTGR